MKAVLNLIAYLGALAKLSAQTLAAFIRPPWELRSLIYQLDSSGIGSWSITVLTAIFTGMVLALQFSSGLKDYGASMYTGKLVSLGIVRELGPVLTALLVGGRVGSGFAAELGSMAVTEQIDAIRALGADPVKKLVAPRVIACMIALPLLTVLADLIGCFGGMIITVQEVGVTPRFFYSQVVETLGIVDLLHGLGKSVFFGYTIGITGCFVGMNTTGGTEGVGLSTTKAVVASAIGVLVSDFLLTKLFIALYG
ncbi:MAG: ABC transporter permease [Myxococcales bacterium]|nr:ABC transporter permease [Myxococcales bacterium]